MAHSTLRRLCGYAGLARNFRKAQRSSSETVADNARQHLAERMGRLRGLPQKMGQILSMSADVHAGDGSSDPSAAQPFAHLCTSGSAIPLAEVLEVIAEEWGHAPDDVIEFIDPEGLAASLGQVHRAQLIDGREVAIKVQYPGIEGAVRQDLKALGWLSTAVGDLRRGFDLSEYRRVVMEDLEQELDYGREADQQEAFRKRLVGTEFVVPRVHRDLSGSRVMVTEWQDGETLAEAARWPLDARRQLGRSLVRRCVEDAFLPGGVLHADPHPGNYRFRRASTGVEVVLYDFGSVTIVDRDRQLALLHLIRSAQQGEGDPYPAYLALGFDPDMLEPLRPKLAALSRVLFQPFVESGPFDLAQWHRAERLADVLGDDRWNFRMSGPASLIFLTRALHGIFHNLSILGAPVSWSHILEPVLAARRDELDSVQWPAPKGDNGFESLARYLKVQVTEAGKVKVALGFPARTIEDLAQVMGEELVDRLTRSGIQLTKIVRAARQSQYRPMELFDLPERGSERGVRVWLE